MKATSLALCAALLLIAGAQARDLKTSGSLLPICDPAIGSKCAQDGNTWFYSPSRDTGGATGCNLVPWASDNLCTYTYARNCDQEYGPYGSAAMANKCATDGKAWYYCQSGAAANGCRLVSDGLFSPATCSKQCTYHKKTYSGCASPPTLFPPFVSGSAAGPQVCPHDGSEYHYCAQVGAPSGPASNYPADTSSSLGAGGCQLKTPFISSSCGTGNADQCSVRITRWCVDFMTADGKLDGHTIGCPVDGTEWLYCRTGASKGGCRKESVDGFFPYEACQFQCRYQKSP